MRAKANTNTARSSNDQAVVAPLRACNDVSISGDLTPGNVYACVPARKALELLLHAPVIALAHKAGYDHGAAPM
jgi:hypothetical protein